MATVLLFAVPFTILLKRMFVGDFTSQFAACVAILAAFLIQLADVRLTFLASDAGTAQGYISVIG